MSAPAAGTGPGLSEPLLVDRVRQEILGAPGHRITFARFMERVLTEPGLGYYVTSDERPTREGDFLTAPELHPFFGRCSGRLLSEVWRRLGAPDRFVVREWGAGRGTLAANGGFGSGRGLDRPGIDHRMAAGGYPRPVTRRRMRRRSRAPSSPTSTSTPCPSIAWCVVVSACWSGM